MKDLVGDIGLSNRLISVPPEDITPVDYSNAALFLEKKISASKDYLSDQILN